MIVAFRSLFLAGFVTTASVAGAEATRSISSFDDVNGWEVDEYGAALSDFQNKCGDLDNPDWQALCGKARF